MSGHYIVGDGIARGCTHCGVLYIILNGERVNGKLPLCPDAPTATTAEAPGELIIDRMEKKIEATLGKAVERLKEQINEGSYLLLDPWNDLTTTSIGRATDLKSQFLKFYGIDINAAFCMATGIVPPRPPPNEVYLKLAHLLPRSSKRVVMEALGMTTNDIDTFSNTILLCSHIEEQFDRLNISFVPADNPFANYRFVMKIWDNNIKSLPVYPGSPRLIGEFENSPLMLNISGVQHNIFRRVISYQGFMACRKWIKFDQVELPLDCDISEYRGSYRNSRKEYAKRFAKDLHDEVEDM